MLSKQTQENLNVGPDGFRAGRIFLLSFLCLNHEATDGVSIGPKGIFLRSPNLGGHSKIPVTQAEEMMQKMRLFIKYLVVKMQGNGKSPSKFLKVGHEPSWWRQIFFFTPIFGKIHDRI